MEIRKRYYPWVIMLASCLFAGASIGIGTNCGSIFMPVMAKEFGVGLGTIASQMTLMCVAMSAGSLWVGRVINRIDIRILMTLSAALTGCGFLTQGLVQNLWQYYLTGIILGAGISMGSFMTITVIINNWFVKNRGMVIGLTLSVSSVVGILMNPVLNSVIENQGWRVAVSVKGLLLLITIPMVWLFIRMRPSDIGSRAWGDTEAPAERAESEQTQQTKTAGGNVSIGPLLMMILFVFIFTICMNHSGHLQNIAASAGFSSSVGALMVSAYLAGEFIGKLGLGWLNDKYGINRAVTAVVSVGMLGILGLFFVEQLGPNFGLLCGLLFGPMTATTSVGFTLIANNIFGPEKYPLYYPYMSIASTVAFSVGSPIIGYLYDFTGTWTLSYGIVLGGLGVSLLLLHVSTKMMAADRK